MEAPCISLEREHTSSRNCSFWQLQAGHGPSRHAWRSRGAVIDQLPEVHEDVREGYDEFSRSSYLMEQKVLR
jgi:hypothetical protein